MLVRALIICALATIGLGGTAGAASPAKCTPKAAKRCAKPKPRPVPAPAPKPRDTRPPSLLAATAEGTTLTLAYDEPLAVYPTDVRYFAVRVGGVPRAVVAARVAGATVVLTLGRPVHADDVVDVSYLPGLSSVNAVSDLASNFAEHLSYRPAVNRGAPGCSQGLASVRGGLLDEGELDPRLRPPALGAVQAVMLFVDFPDAVATESPQSLFDRLVPEAQRWFAEASYGRMSLSVTPVPRWFRIGRSSRPIPDAVAAADPSVDFSRYQLVYVVTPNEAKIATVAYPADIPSAEGTLRGGAIFGGDILGVNAITPPREAPYEAAVLLHETGHVFGLPDLYVRDGSSPPLGVWDSMAQLRGAHLVAWQKWKLGWLDPQQLRCVHAGSLEEMVTPLETPGGVKAVVVPTSTTTAYVAEVRRPLGFDSFFCDGGVLIYTVDSSLPTFGRPIKVQAAAPWSPSADGCGQHSRAAFDLGPGEVSAFEDAAVKIELLATDGSSYRLRVTRK